VAEEYREHFGEHAYDDEGNYIGPAYDTSQYEEAWAEVERLEGEAPSEQPAPTAPAAAADVAGEAGDEGADHAPSPDPAAVADAE
jgi:hypothetical protein